MFSGLQRNTGKSEVSSFQESKIPRLAIIPKSLTMYSFYLETNLTAVPYAMTSAAPCTIAEDA